MSHDISNHPHWSKKEFLAFLLLYAADADMECTDDERAMIRSGIDKEHLQQVETEYQRLTDFERITVIKMYQPKYCQTAADKESLLKCVEELFEADGEFDILEHNVFLMLQKIL